MSISFRSEVIEVGTNAHNGNANGEAQSAQSQTCDIASSIPRASGAASKQPSSAELTGANGPNYPEVVSIPIKALSCYQGEGVLVFSRNGQLCVRRAPIDESTSLVRRHPQWAERAFASRYTTNSPERRGNGGIARGDGSYQDDFSSGRCRGQGQVPIDGDPPSARGSRDSGHDAGRHDGSTKEGCDEQFGLGQLQTPDFAHDYC